MRAFAMGVPYSVPKLSQAVDDARAAGSVSHSLRPIYCHDHEDASLSSGALWMAMFGRPGRLILGPFEFEGKPGIEGTFSKLGVLADPDYSFIQGVLLIVHPWDSPAEIWVLLRSADWELWRSTPEIPQAALKLIGACHNDDLDGNGFALSRLEWS
jgi:hypothetical protein